ncbi:MAG: UvrD-helicase domain-containing protein [Verrucomicrobia bacterium]|nr:UvrD-helicase domain-containing protein [Verrucomicrobiota bacterium]
MSKIVRGLNSEQRRAVLTTRGPLLVLAGAGTGKTRVITHRIAQMLSERVPASQILAMTFTNKAAGEMKERLRKLVGKNSAAELTVGTFHSFCVKSLRQHGDVLGLRQSFGICDAEDQLMAMKQALRDLQIPETELPPKVCVAHISLLKNRLVYPPTCLASADAFEVRLGHVFERYNQTLRSSGVLDFDDLLLYMVKLIEQPSMLKHFRDRYRYLFVDEYQDTNGPQYEIVKQIAQKHRNVCVVGDDDQSIYGWRGADVTKILNFEKDFPDATVVRLETNYRSTPQIIQAANAIIRNNRNRHDKALRSEARDGESVVVKRLDDEEAEAQFVVEDIKQRIWESKSSYGEFAILFRTAVQPRLFEMRLRGDNIPYLLVGGMSFFDRKEVRDILAYLKLISNPADELSLLRVINTPPRGIGATAVERMLAIAVEERLSLSEVIARGDSFASLRPATVSAAQRFLDTIAQLRDLAHHTDLVDLIKRLIRAVAYDEEIKRCYKDASSRAKRWEAVSEIMNMAEIHHRRNGDRNLGQFLDDLSLNATDEEKDEPSENRMTLMTLHSAKGLEFGEVYLVGVEEGLLPHAKSIKDSDVDEERRLAYVGITRAQRRLTLTCVKSRARQGQRTAVLPSRFIYELGNKEVPQKLLEASARTFAEPSPVQATVQKKPTRKRSSKKLETKGPPAMVKRRAGLAGGDI